MSKLKREGLNRVVAAAERALGQYDPDNVDAVLNEETGKVDILYHSDTNSFAIEAGVADAEGLDLKALAEELDEISVGHCW